MEKLYLFSNLQSNITEGGMARNFAFYKELSKRNAKIFCYRSMSPLYRLMSIIKNFYLFCTVRNSTICILQNTFITYIFPIAFFGNSFLLKICSFAVKRLTKNNNCYFEVNDLMYEQSIDLEIDINSNVIKYQEFIFGIQNLKFIFASHKMRDYVIEKYNVDLASTQVIINGAPKLKEDKSNHLDVCSDILKFVYVGTLNQGREIDTLLKLFKNSRHQLYLIGTEGSWIELENSSNVFYLGAYPETQALEIISKYDVGVIPYNDKKFYYNLCYPTKNSFYISAGLPILCTVLEESRNVLNQYGLNISIFEEQSGWSHIIENLTTEELVEMKSNINKVKSHFYWENILSRLSLD